MSHFQVLIKSSAKINVPHRGIQTIRSASELTGTKIRVGPCNKIQLNTTLDIITGQPQYAEVLFIFTVVLPLHSNETLHLAFIHYFDTPGANAWLIEHGSLTTRSEEDIMMEESQFLSRARVVAPTFLSNNQPYLAVVPMSSIERLASFAPRYIGESMDCDSWYIYDVIQPLQSDLDLLDEVQAKVSNIMV